MLTHIFVKDLVIVDSLELDFTAGMTALTGETGAGKSILIDALGLALGDKADADMIRAGCERAEVAATFTLENCPDARAWLIENELADGDECMLRRVLARGSRSRAYINARPATTSQLRVLGEYLVDIHGQHAHQSLLRANEQRRLLDAYGGHLDAAGEVARLYRTYRELDERLARIESERSARSDRLAELREQLGELGGLEMTADELTELDNEHKRLANLGALQETTARLLAMLYEDEAAVHGLLNRAVHDLDDLARLDAELASPRELVEGAAIQIEEAAGVLRRYLDRLEVDPSRLDEVEYRLSQIHDAARKYRLFPEQIPERVAELTTELSTLEADDTALADLAAERDRAQAAYRGAAGELTRAREQAAAQLGETVTQSMRGLGMPKGEFAVAVTGDGREGPHGTDRIEFMVSANPGQPQQPLAKVASGGELSRISLCIQVATAACGSVPTLVFDEVDVGIGGGVAEIVGGLLRSLGSQRQVLCVTHLPQVAAQSHEHLRVQKRFEGERTFASIAVLDDGGRVEEIARMLGGREITTATIEHAREMIQRATVES